MSERQSAKVHGHYHGTTNVIISTRILSYLVSLNTGTQEEEGEPRPTVTDRFPHKSCSYNGQQTGCTGQIVWAQTDLG